VPALLIGIATVLYLDNNVRSAKWLNEREKQLLEDEIAAQPQEKEQHAHSLKAVFADPRMWWMSLIYFAFVTGQYGLTFWMPTLVKSTGITDTFQIGLLSAIPFVVAIVVMNLFGHSADKRRERRWHLIIPALMGSIGFAVAASYSHDTAVSIVFLSVAAGGVLTCAPLFWSLPTAFLAGSAAAAGIAIINSIGNLAGFASPYVIGYLKDLTHSTSSGMYVLSDMLVIGAIAVWLTPAKLVNR
jgi:nitrate/nitrite transporter NarK